jgi:hypothetical protein
MNTTDQMLQPKFNPIGLVLAIIGGAAAAAAMGYLYFMLANDKFNIGRSFDYVVILAIVIGAVVGAVVGRLAVVGGFRMTLIVFLIAFVFGVGGYAARYYFEFEDTVNAVIEQSGSNREAVLNQLARAYPPGGYFGYLQIVAEVGFSLTGRGSSSSSSSSDSPDMQGSLAWGLLGVEALAAGLTAGFTARGALTNKKKSNVIPPPPMSNTPMPSQ